ncbi:MAG TPA: sulfate adenylyltransferase, partial [Anaerolineae bacterium]|nr:sulfate adenylyltransferase [Anaerolineae bacterium]
MNEAMHYTISPHGGALVDRVLRGEVRKAVRERAERMVKVPLGRMGLSDLELLATGALSPLTGFMLKADYDRCVKEMRLVNGLVWTIPITLAVEEDLADDIREGQEIALCEGERVLAVMEVAEKYPYDR